MRRKRPVPLFVWPLLGILVLAALATGFRLSSNDKLVPVPVGDLVPGQLITAQDIVVKKIDGYGLGDVLESSSSVVGHAATTSLRRGQPIPEHAVTQRVPGDYQSRIRIRFRAEEVASDHVTNGQRVHLLFAPTGEASALPAVEVDAVLVDTAKDGDATVYFVAIPPGERDALLARVGRSRLLVTAG
jgi:hypothetical protein